MGIADGDTVTIEYVGRLDDGTAFDTSRESVAAETGLDEENPGRAFDPLTVEIGSKEVIEGLESALLEMEAGDTATVEVDPEEGYGERSEDRVAEYDIERFRTMVGDVDPQEGMQVQTEDGLPGRVRAIDGETVTVDFNHELAGEHLTFEVEVVSVD